MQSGNLTVNGTASISSTIQAASNSKLGTLTFKDGEITDENNNVSFSDNNISTSGDLSANNVTVTGNLLVEGTTTTVNTENITVKDPLMVLSSNVTDAPSADSGLIVERGTSNNVGFIWDESSDHFAVINTTESGNTNGNVSISSYADLRINDLLIGGSTLTSTDADKIIGVTDGTLSASKAIVTDSNSHVNEMNIGTLKLGTSGNTVEVTSSAAELNLLSSSSAGVVNNNKAVIYSNTGGVSAQSLTLGGSEITANASEINILDGVSGITNTNINQLSGVTSSIKADLLDRYTQNEANNKFGVKEGSGLITTIGSVAAGSLVSGFGTIDIESDITTTKNVDAGSLTVDQVQIDNSYIGHTSAPLLMKLSDGKVTIDGELNVSDITLDGTALSGNAADGINKISAVSSTQSELDILSGATIDTGELNRLKGLTYNIKDKFNLKLDISKAQDTYAPKAGSSNIVTVGALTSGSIGGAMVINTTGNITGSTVTGSKFKTTGLEITDNKIGNSSVPELVTISGNNVAVDGTVNTSSLQLSGSAVTASASEINKLDGLTTSKAELQFVKGVGSSIQDQIDARITDNDANDRFVPLAGHASIATVGTLTAGSIDGPAFGVINITSNITTTGDVNADAFKTGSIVMKDANIGHSGDPTLMTVSAGLLNVSGTVKATGLNLNNTPVNATASEINKLAGLSVTKSELEYLSGVTVSSNLKDDLAARYTKTETDGLFDDFTGQNKITTVGALTSGSIGSGFTSISTETPIQTTSTLSGSSVTGGSITLSGSVISHSSDPTLMTLSSGKVTVGGELKTTSLTLGNSPVTANAGEINKLTGLSTTATELGYLNGVSGPIQTQIGLRYTKIGNQ